MALGILHELRRRIETHRLAVEHCGENRNRFMVLQPCIRVGVTLKHRTLYAAEFRAQKVEQVKHGFSRVFLPQAGA
jgi:hypothetical protein